jgi:2'-5' RNA ligase
MEPVRAFIAIQLPNSVKSALSQLQDNLKQSDHAPVKWVDTDSIHLTLKFLGNIAAATIPELTKALSDAEICHSREHRECSHSPWLST